MNYGYVIDRAWNIFWKYKVFWLFGFLASCGQVNLQPPSYNYSTDNLPAYFPEEFKKILDPTKIEQMVDQNLPEIIGVIFGIFALGLLIQFVFFVIRSFGITGLIKGVLQVEQGAERLSFGELFQETLPYVWKLIGLNFFVPLILYVGFTVIFSIILIPIGIFVSANVLILILFSLLCIAFIGVWLIIVSMKQANIALVAEDLKILGAMKRGWKIVRENIRTFLLISFILFILGIILTTVASIPMVFVYGSTFAGIENGSMDQLNQAFFKLSPILIIFTLVYGLVIWFYKTYMQAFWTLVYLQFAEPEKLIDELEPETI